LRITYHQYFRGFAGTGSACGETSPDRKFQVNHNPADPVAVSFQGHHH
jgi:hypothetical protein